MGTAASTLSSSITSIGSSGKEDFQHVHDPPTSLLMPSLEPGTQPGQVLHVHMRTNPRGKITYASDASTFPCQVKGSGRRIVLEEEIAADDGQASTKARLAVILPKDPDHDSGDRIIYSEKPCFPGQKPTEGNHSVGEYLYPWAKVSQVSEEKFKMESMDPKDRSTVHAQALNNSGGNSLKVTKGLFMHTCGTITRGKPSDGSFGDKPFWSIKIAPGIDPALFLCLVAVIEDMLR